MGSLTFATLPEDFSESEKQQLIKYVDNGVPGMTTVKESEIFQWFTMYMAGKTFSEIAIGAKVPKDKVLFIAHKNKWLDKKLKHFDDITVNLQKKISSAKIDSANTISTIIASFNKYYNEQFTKFLKTGDASILEGMDTKLLSQYQKAIESLDKIMGSTKSKDGESAPPINLNFGNANIKENEDGSIDVNATPPPDKKMMGDILKLLSQAQQDKEKDKL